MRDVFPTPSLPRHTIFRGIGIVSLYVFPKEIPKGGSSFNEYICSMLTDLSHDIKYNFFSSLLPPLLTEELPPRPSGVPSTSPVTPCSSGSYRNNQSRGRLRATLPLKKEDLRIGNHDSLSAGLLFSGVGWLSAFCSMGTKRDKTVFISSIP